MLSLNLSLLNQAEEVDADKMYMDLNHLFYEKDTEKDFLTFKQGIKPILGMEGYITSGNLAEKVERSRDQNFHILLIAKNLEGYKNLIHLVTISNLEGYYYKPRMDKEILRKYSKYTDDGDWEYVPKDRLEKK